MTRPARHSPFDPEYDFEFRPATYWPSEPSDRGFLARIRGTARRRVAQRALGGTELARLGGDDLYKEAMEFVLEEELDEGERHRWGRIDPQMMGGEYLPRMAGEEVEVARIELESVTADVLEVRAAWGDDGEIRYRLVDEYETTFEISPQTSSEPLTRGRCSPGGRSWGRR